MATDAQIFTESTQSNIRFLGQTNFIRERIRENSFICGKKNMFFNVFCNKVRLPGRSVSIRFSDPFSQLKNRNQD